MSTTMTQALCRPLEATAGNDQATVLRAKGGDLAAREELASSCQRQAYLFALHLTGRAEEAAENESGHGHRTADRGRHRDRRSPGLPAFSALHSRCARGR